jgi:hypothetical protein
MGFRVRLLALPNEIQTRKVLALPRVMALTSTFRPET